MGMPYNIYYMKFSENRMVWQGEVSGLRRPAHGQIFSNIHENYSWVMIFNSSIFGGNRSNGLDFYSRYTHTHTHTHTHIEFYIN